MIDKEGKHGEIVINKKSSEMGAAIEKIDVNVVLLTTQQTGKMVLGGDAEFFHFAKNQLKNTYQRKVFSGDVSNQVYKASFNFDIKAGLTNEQIVKDLKTNPVANYLTVDGNDARGNRMSTHASSRRMNYNTSQFVRFPNPFAHEISHLLGARGDNFDGKNYMSDYQMGRNVQDEEVKEFLDPAIQLANGFEGKTIKIHFFTSTDESGNDVSDGSGKYNTYKVYDEASGNYLKSVTVPLSNPNPSNK